MENENKTGVPRNERIAGFSDGVFAIVITLLVLEIKVPEIEGSAVGSELPHALVGLLPRLLAHFMSFAVLGIYWIGHHTMFMYIKRHDRVLLWLNILFLMFVALMPFPAAMMSRYPDQFLPMVIFCSLLIMAGIVGDITWGYATAKGRLSSESATPEVVALMHRRLRLAPILYLSVIFLSMFTLTGGKFLLVAIILLYVIPNPLTDPHRHHLVDD